MFVFRKVMPVLAVIPSLLHYAVYNNLNSLPLVSYIIQNMKTYLPLLLMLCAVAAHGQDTTTHKKQAMHNSYVRHSVIPSVSLGFVDEYRNNYSLPSGFSKGNTSGFVPVYVKLEYGLSNHVGLAATVAYDAFNYNFRQQFEGNNGTFNRNKTNAFRMFSSGLTAFYHLGDVIHVKRLDPFVGLGFTINNIRYSAYPQGDSTMVRTDHNAAIYLKAGTRYYISDKFSLYGDLGYDKHTIFSLGFSCRFLPAKKKD